MTADRANMVASAHAATRGMETLPLQDGPVQRLAAPITSPVLLAIPATMRPKPIVACASCPEGSWSLDEKLRLTCQCAARRYIAWTPGTNGLILCDDREAALAGNDPL